MVTITAIIRARPNAQNIVRDALLSVVEAVRETEPQTVSYFVTQSVG
jgi:quinol monooxygenase YgiN